MAGKVVNLAVGLASFAQYDFTCERGYAFSESYFAKPAAEILAALYPGMTVLTEVAHPTLKRTGRGDKLRVDVAALAPPPQGKRRWDGSPRAFLELKWCGDTVPKALDVLWDLVRLASISYLHPDVDCYFALIGLRSKVDQFFSNIATTRVRNGKSGPFLRQTESAPFPDLKLPQLEPALHTEIMAKLGNYPSSALDTAVAIKQAETVRHDAGPFEERPKMKPRIGLTAIVNRVSARTRR